MPAARPARTRPPLSISQVAEVRVHAAQGLTIDQIAERSGIAVDLVDLGLRGYRGGTIDVMHALTLRAEGLTWKAVARVLGRPLESVWAACHPKPLSARRRRLRLPMSQDQVIQAQRMREIGYSTTQIAEAMDVGYQQVIAACRDVVDPTSWRDEARRLYGEGPRGRGDFASLRGDRQQRPSRRGGPSPPQQPAFAGDGRRHPGRLRGGRETWRDPRSLRRVHRFDRASLPRPAQARQGADAGMSPYTPAQLRERRARMIILQAAIEANGGTPPDELFSGTPFISDWWRVEVPEGGYVLAGVVLGHPRFLGLGPGTTARVVAEGPGWALTEGRLYRVGRPREPEPEPEDTWSPSP